jgi:membrane protein implicated in regulation of membrane protease activity
LISAAAAATAAPLSLTLSLALTLSLNLLALAGILRRLTLLALRRQQRRSGEDSNERQHHC